MRVIVSLTTVPSRMKYISKTLASIMRQDRAPDEIYLCIPFISLAEDCEYNISLEITNYCNIIRCQDYGPITKLIGILPIETDPDTIIITVDDDVVYPEEMIQKLLTKHRLNPSCAIGSAGYKIGGFPFYYSAVQNQHDYNTHGYSFTIPPEGEAVDVLDSTPGILYLRKFFPSADQLDRILRYSVLTDDTIRNDSLVICGYLSKKGITNKVFNLPRITEIPTVESTSWATRSTKLFSAIKAYRALRKEGCYPNLVSYKRNRTRTFPFILGLGIIILFSSMLATKRKL